MTTINVLELCEAYGGGVKRQVDYLHEYLNPDSFRATFLVSTTRNQEYSNDYLVSDSLSKFIKSPIAAIHSLRLIHKIVRENDIQIIHAHSSIAGIIAMSYKIIYGSKLKMIYTPHAYYSESKRKAAIGVLIRAVERKMNRTFDRIIHVSAEEEKYALTHKLVNRNKSVVIANGIQDFEVAKKTSVDSTFINVARCGYQKNPELFIDIAECILHEEESFKFIWVGDGPLLDKCRALVKEKGIQDSVSFVGYSKEVFGYLENANVFFSTSRYEGLPFSVIEAMAAKLPVILTNVIGHQELVKDNGILISSNADSTSSSTMIAKFTDVLANEKEMGMASYQIFQKKYRVEDMIKKIEQIYSEE